MDCGVKFTEKECFFCNGKMIHLNPSNHKLLDCEYGCADKNCWEKNCYQVWLDNKSKKIRFLMFVCAGRDIEVSYEKNETIIYDQKDGVNILFSLNGVFNPTLERNYEWFENKIKNYNLLM